MFAKTQYNFVITITLYHVIQQTSMNQKSKIGRLGEDIACEYLVNKGFTIIERNFRKPWGEIDIIAQDKDRTLVFIEVKTMKEYGNDNPAIAGLLPEENLTAAKLKKLKWTASLYAGYNQNLINDEKGWRIDLVAISLKNKIITSNAVKDEVPDSVRGETFLIWKITKNLYKQLINLFSRKPDTLTRPSNYFEINHLENI